MKLFSLFTVLMVAGLLGACQATAPAPAVVAPKASSKVLTIAQVTGNDFNKACAVFNQAAGYYADVAWLVSAANPTVGAAANAAISAGQTICSLPSGSLSSDLAKLNALWVKVQAFTKVP